MHNLLVKLSERMDRSSNYQKTKSFFRALLDDVNYPYKKYFDMFMVFLIIVSITVLILDRSGKVPPWLVTLELYIVTAIFALEYLLRLWISQDIHKVILAKYNNESSDGYWFVLKSKIRYMLSLPALIDLVAIFPKFRIIRLLKLYHYMHGASSLFNALLKKRFEFIFLGYLLFGITFTLGSIFYLLEFELNDKIASYLDGIYWALVTVSTVGYGDITPVTELGKILAMFAIVTGIAMISFVTSIMVSAFSERFDELRNQDSINNVQKMHDVVIINGYGHLGATIAKKLKADKVFEPVIIEEDEAKAHSAQIEGLQVIHADGSSAKLIKSIVQGKNIAAMLTLRTSDIDNIYFILNAKAMKVNTPVYARMNNADLKAQFKGTKVNAIVEPYVVVEDRTFKYLKSEAEKKENHISFFGYSHKSKNICKMLKEDGVEICIYEVDDTRLDAAREAGYEVKKILLESATLPLESQTIAVCAMPEEEVNVYCSITLRTEGFSSDIVALSDSKEDNRKLILAGANKIFDMYEESASRFIEILQENEKI